MSDEEDNIDIEIDVAYKWDVILTLAGADIYASASRLRLRRRDAASYFSTSLLA